MMEKYEQLWECFMSDQMSAMQLDQHIREDKEFEALYTGVTEVK